MKIAKTKPGAMFYAAVVLSTAAACPPSSATELVYFPLNPSFGGSPLNGPVLLNSALATSRHTDPEADDFGLDGRAEQSPLQIFQDTLERAILGRLAASATSRIVGEDGRLIPGNLETDNFSISIVDLGGGVLSITTIDKVTGGSTTFQVGQ